MIMNMNEKGRQVKLLAAFAILAMVICAFAVSMPTSDAAGETSVEVNSAEGLSDALSGNYTTIDITGSFSVSSVINISKDVTINGNDYTISASSDGTWTGNNPAKFLMNINNNTVTLNDITLDSNNVAAGLNVYGGDVSMTDVSLLNSTGIGMTINGTGDASVDASNLVTSGNATGGINIDDKTGTATLELNGTVKIAESPRIWSESDSTVTNNTETEFVKSFVGGVAVYTQVTVVEPSGDTITTSDIETALAQTGVARLPDETVITPELIPDVASGETIIIPADATFEDGVTLTAATGASIQFDGVTDQSFTVNGGTTSVTSVFFNNVSGNFTVTGGSVEVTGEIDDGNIDGEGTADVLIHDLTINGEVSISGTGAVELENIIIAASAKLTLGDGIDYTISGTFTNNGTLTLNTILDVGNTTITGTDFGTITGTGSIKSNSQITGLSYAAVVSTQGQAAKTYYFDGVQSFEIDAQQSVAGGSQLDYAVEVIAGDNAVTISKQNDKVVYKYTGEETKYGTGLYVEGSATPINSTYYNTSSVTVTAISEELVIGGVVAFGDVDIPYNVTVTVKSGANLVIPAGTETVFMADYVDHDNDSQTEEQLQQAQISNEGTIFVYGTLALGSDATASGRIACEGGATVYASNVAQVQLFVTGAKVSELSEVTVTIDSNDSDPYQKLVDNLGTGVKIFINTTVTVPANERLEIIGENIEFGSAGDIVVIGALSITDSVLDKDDTEGNDAMITVNAKAKLDIVDSKIFMVVNAIKDSQITVDNADVTYDNTTSNVKVGYGTILYLSGTPTDDVEVYGTLDVSGTVNITSGINMNVYQGATLQVSGTLNVAGVIDVASGATVNVTGTIAVANEYGGAAINTDGKFTVAAEGTVTIDGADSRYGQDNFLNITGEDFVVEGTLAMEGTLSGAIQDKGTVTINGKAGADAKVVVYDGVTLTVTSVEPATGTTSTLTITDDGAATDVKGDKRTNECYEGNTVITAGAKNLSVTVAVKTVGTGEKRVYVSNMTVTGNINGNTTVSSAYDYDKDMGYGLEVTGDVAVQKGTLTFGKDVLLSGNVTATAKSTDVSVTGELTVTGSVVMGGENNTVDGIGIVGEGILNATGYTVTTETSDKDYVTYYYGSFDAIVLKIADADDDEIFVYGAQELGANATIAADQTVTVNRGAALTIGADFELTMADGSKMENNGTVEAEGKLSFANFTSTYGRSDAGIVAQVVVMDDPARTYMSLTVAIEDGMTDITLYQNVTITEDLTIPEGVTVTGENKTFTVYAEENDVTLTVAGSLVLVDNSTFATAYETDASGNDYEAETIVTGNMIYSKTDASGADASPMYGIEGAHFESEHDVEDVYVISNVVYAAENCHTGNIVITGSVSVGDVTFSADEDEGALTVMVKDIYENGTLVKNSALVAGTITLVRGGEYDATINLFTVGTDGLTNGTVTGTIATAAGSVDLSRANGVVIAATSAEVDGETVDVAGLSGAVNGDVTVSAGTVTAGTLGIAKDSVDDEYIGTFTVASGATLTVPDNVTVTGAVDADGEALFVVDGTIVFDEGDLSGTIAVNGTMQVPEDFTLAATIDLAGTIAVADDMELTVNGKIEMDAGATITGTVSVEQGYIIAMPGADLTGATLNWNPASGESDVATTEYYVNGDLYATVYAQERTWQIGTALDADEIDIPGYDEVYGWYSAQEDADKALAESSTTNGDADSKYVGAVAQIYGAANVSKVNGTISEGTGLTIYIDGLTISNWQENSKYYLTVGTHVVTIAANANYSIDNATITFNGQTVVNGGTITIGADDTTFTLSATGAVPSGQTVVIDGGNGGSDMGLTDYLLIVLVILIVIMAIIVALRLMRS